MTKTLSFLYFLLFASLANAVDSAPALSDKAGAREMAVALSLYLCFCVAFIGLAWYKARQRKRVEEQQ